MTVLEQAWRYLESRHEAMVETLGRWCRLQSGSHDVTALRVMAEALQTDYSHLGNGPRIVPTVPFSLVKDDGTATTEHSGDIVRWDHGEEAKSRLLLMIHYDTVYATSELPPEIVITTAGQMRAPGAADAKGGLLVMLEALAAARKFGIDDEIGWTAVANPDEEIGSPASTPWMREHAEHFDFGLLFEPRLPDGAMVAARKGSGNFALVVHGRSAHAGRNPADGRNAVIKLCHLLARVDALNDPAVGTTVNVAKVVGGSALNRVPDLAVGRFNVRVVDDASRREFLSRLEELVTLHNADGEFRVELSGSFQSPPKPVTPDFQRLQTLVEAAADTVGQTIQWRDTGGACDGSKLAAAGLVNIDTLGPCGDRLHSPDEWVDLNSLVPAAKLTLAILYHYAQQVSTEK